VFGLGAGGRLKGYKTWPTLQRPKDTAPKRSPKVQKDLNSYFRKGDRDLEFG
jgi:hypothetical protein